MQSIWLLESRNNSSMQILGFLNFARGFMRLICTSKYFWSVCLIWIRHGHDTHFKAFALHRSINLISILCQKYFPFKTIYEFIILNTRPLWLSENGDAPHKQFAWLFKNRHSLNMQGLEFLKSDRGLMFLIHIGKCLWSVYPSDVSNTDMTYIFKYSCFIGSNYRICQRWTHFSFLHYNNKDIITT